MTTELPAGIIRNDGSIPNVPVGALVTEPNVARTCVRCGHEECPCCNDWCDSCVRDDPNDFPDARQDGDWIVVKYNFDGRTIESRHHIECAREMSCKYDREPHPLMLAIHEANDRVFANIGGSFGVTEDGRVWFHGETQEEYDARQAREAAKRARMLDETRTTRRSKMTALEKMFREMTTEQRAAYIEGMKHVQMLVEWTTEDFGHAGKRTSKAAAEKVLGEVAGGIVFFETIHAEENDK